MRRDISNIPACLNAINRSSLRLLIVKTQLHRQCVNFSIRAPTLRKKEGGEENAWLENKDMANNFFVVLIYEYYY